ncbi:MAG: FHA domain-containing protein [Theionarchaea archaeon]|nr:FHA domain-containing protein [Theionarchaea archaeon]
MKDNSRWLLAENKKMILIFTITILLTFSGMNRLYEPSIVLGQENVLCGKISTFTFDPICPSTGIKFWITIVSLESCDGQEYRVDYSLADYDGKHVMITNPVFGYFEQWCPDWDPSYGIVGWSKVEVITSCDECKTVPLDGGGGSETQYVYIVIYANVAEYEVWVDGSYYFTEGHPSPGASSTSPKPDGICRFPVTPGSHTITLIKDGCEPYTFHVTIKAGEEKEFHVTINCREECEEPSRPTLISPSKNSSPDQPILFSWSSVSGAISYRIQVSANSQFSSLLINTTVARTSYHPSQSFSPGTYYWRVKAINDCGESDWSNTWNFTIECKKPLPPRLLSPENNSTVTPPVTFSWEASEGATLYWFEISAERSMGSLIFNTPISGTYFKVDNETYPFQDGTYYWRVIPENSCGRGESSAIYSFTVGCKRPSAPKLELPSNGGKAKSPVEFVWKPVNNAEFYRIQISEDSDFGAIVHDGKVSGRYSAHLENGTYYWRVKALNDCGESDWSEIWRFVIGDGNSPPIIEKVTISPDYVDIAGSLIINIWASDPDGDELQFFFEPEVGEVCCLTKNSDYAVQNYGEGNYSATLLLRAGIEPGTYTLKVIASDGEFEDFETATYSVISGYDDKLIFSVNVYDVKGNSLEDVYIEVEKNNQAVLSGYTDENGDFESELEKETNYTLKASKEGYKTHAEKFKTGSGPSYGLNFFLENEKGVVITDVNLPTHLVASNVGNRNYTFYIYTLTFKVKNYDNREREVKPYISPVCSFYPRNEYYSRGLFGFSKIGKGCSLLFYLDGPLLLGPGEEWTIGLDIFFISPGQYNIEIGAEGINAVFTSVNVKDPQLSNIALIDDLHHYYDYLFDEIKREREEISILMWDIVGKIDEGKESIGDFYSLLANKLRDINPISGQFLGLAFSFVEESFIKKALSSINPQKDIYEKITNEYGIDAFYEKWNKSLISSETILRETQFSDEGWAKIKENIGFYHMGALERQRELDIAIDVNRINSDLLEGDYEKREELAKGMKLGLLGGGLIVTFKCPPVGLGLAGIYLFLGDVAEGAVDYGNAFAEIGDHIVLYDTATATLLPQFGNNLAKFEEDMEKLLSETEVIKSVYGLESTYIDIDQIKDSGTSISGGSPVDFVITDQQGRIAGIRDGLFVIEIPGTFILSLGEKGEYVLPINGKYEICLRGKGSGEYHLNISQPTTVRTTDGTEYKTKTEINISGTTNNYRIQTFNYDLNQIASQVSQEFLKIVQERGLTEIDETTRQQIINEAIQRVVNSIDSDGDGIPDVEDRTPVPSKFDWRGFFAINIKKYSSFMLIFLVIGVIGILGAFAYSRMGKTIRVQVSGFGEIGTLKSIPREAQLIVSGSKFWIEKSYITIGRGENADIKITDSDKLISDIHAEFYRDETGQYWVKDSSSANGTFIHRNGKYIEMRKWALYDGDKIGLCYDSQRRKVVPIIFKITRKSEEEIDGKMIKETDAKIIIEGRRIPLTKESMTIGKGEEADIRITDSDIAVSEIHARIYKDEKGQYWIEDKNSGNGTFIYLFGEYRRIKMWRLYDGDIVGLCYDPAVGKQYPIIFERSKRYERRFLKSPIFWDIFSES